MKNKCIIVSLFIITLVLFSCSPKEHVEYEYYGNSDTVRVKRSYPDLKNDSTFYETTYYKNGQRYAEGLVVDFLNEGEWNVWYQDGVPKNTITYHRGNIEYGSIYQKKPQLILLDSLIIGKKTLVKITNLYPKHTVIYETDGKVGVEIIDNPNFDRAIIPIYGTYIDFYYEKLIEIKADITSMENLSNKQIFIDDNHQQVKMYKKEKTKIGRANIYK